MSSWIVSKAMVDTIVQQAVHEGLVPMSGATEAVRTLWTTNIAAFVENYEGRHIAEAGYERRALEAVGSCRFAGVEAQLDPHFVAGAIASYSYQSDVSGAWDVSEARTLVEALDALLSERYGCCRETRVEGSWDFEDVHDAIAAQPRLVGV